MKTFIFKQKGILTLSVFLFFLLAFNKVSNASIENSDSINLSSGEELILSNSIDIYGVLNGEITHKGEKNNSGLELLKKIEKTNSPLYYRISIELNNHSDTTFTATIADSLILKFGSIPHQLFENHFGYSPSSRSEAQLVGSNNGKASSYLIQELPNDTIPWAIDNLNWIGLHDRYFAFILLPEQLKTTKVNLPFSQAIVKVGDSDSEIKPNEFPQIHFNISLSSIAPRGSQKWDFIVYSGPKSRDALSSGIVNLKSLLFVGQWELMRWICFALLAMLKAIHFIVPNWGLAIILLALVVRVLLYPLSKKAMKSQQRFINAQKLMLPEMKEIKQKFKGGEQSERILQLHKKHNVSPFAGLKPLLIVLIQLPILIALFHVLGTAFELRNAPFLWIETLAEPDKLFSFGFNIPFLGDYFNLLPVLMSVFTLLSFKLAPAPTTEDKDKGMQNLFLLGMTLMFFFLFYSFPAGLVLYWTFANVFHVVQHRLMVKYVKV